MKKFLRRYYFHVLTSDIMPTNVFTGSLLFSHILPVIFGFIGTMLMISGIMEDDNQAIKIGIILFIIAAIMPFLILIILL